jgi:hypothetical protein
MDELLARRIYFSIAVAASLVLVAVLLFVRSRVRENRQRTIEELQVLFFPKLNISIAAFDYVRAKYEMSTAAEKTVGQRITPPTSTFTLLGAAIPYVLICSVGFLVLLMPYEFLIANARGAPLLTNNLFWLMAAVGEDGASKRLSEAAAVMGAAFLGGYLMTGRMLLRAVQNYELTPLTFLQAATHLAFGIVSGMMVFHVLRGVGAVLGLAETLPEFNAFLLIAFLGGYAPDLGLAILVQYLRIRVFKPTDREALGRAHTLPLELLDGIDYDTRHRLDQAGITDAQILATSNPILLYVETPFGLYCTFDWVLQAQLCVAVGAPTFQQLKQRNIRTSLDLERAVLSDDAPAEFVTDLGRIIFPPAGGAEPLGVEAVKHGVMVMIDDLHIHRVRMLWRHIFTQIAGKEQIQWLYRQGSVLDGDAAPATGTAGPIVPEAVIVAVPKDADGAPPLNPDAADPPSP